jgi:deazaflavin-dependent oxidoreductase (nitroreductase family)
MALIYGQHGDDYLVVASKGGADKHPSWYLNLADNPEVRVQVRGDKFDARARTATAEEKPELWRTMVGEWPPYDEYQAKTEREIPVVVLERS